MQDNSSGVFFYSFTLLPRVELQPTLSWANTSVSRLYEGCEQSYSIQYIDISMFSLFASRHLQNSIQWLFNEIIHCHPYAKKCSKLTCVFHRGPWSSVLPQIFALLLSGIPVGSCVNVDKNFFIRKQTKILGWVLPCVISRRASICRIK